MAAKTFNEWWNNYSGGIDAVIGRKICCRDAWEAATKAAKEKFTGAQQAQPEICPNCHQEEIRGAKHVTSYECFNCGYRW